MFLQQVRDFLVDSCGWVDNTFNDAADPQHLITGWALASEGESGAEKLFMQVGPCANGASTEVNSHLQARYSYLTESIDDTVTTIGVKDTTRFISSGGRVRINDELISYTGVSGSGVGTLTGCTRGTEGTQATDHNIRAVVLSEYDTSWNMSSAIPCITVYGYRDQTVPLVTQATAVAMGVSSVTAAGLTGYGNDHFNHVCFVKPKSGDYQNVLRRVTDYVSTTGVISYEPYPAAPGTVAFDIVSEGFLTGFSRQQQLGDYRLGTVVTSYQYATPGEQTFFLYANLDGLLVVDKLDGAYYMYYFGNLDRYAEWQTTVTTSTVVTGATTIPVNDHTIFEVGAKYRIVSQNAADWAAYQGDYSPKLYADELGTEEVIVSEVLTLPSRIVIGSGLVFSYGTGAVIGEDPRPVVQPKITGKVGMYGTSALMPIYVPKTVGATRRQITSNLEQAELQVASELSSNLATAQKPSYITDKWVGGLVSVYMPSSGYHANNVWENAKGTVPMAWLAAGNNAPYGGADEDTVSARWEGVTRTFRIFKENGVPPYYIVGPEIS